MNLTDRQNEMIDNLVKNLTILNEPIVGTTIYDMARGEVKTLLEEKKILQDKKEANKIYLNEFLEKIQGYTNTQTKRLIRLDIENRFSDKNWCKVALVSMVDTIDIDRKEFMISMNDKGYLYMGDTSYTSCQIYKEYDLTMENFKSRMDGALKSQLIKIIKHLENLK